MPFLSTQYPGNYLYLIMNPDSCRHKLVLKIKPGTNAADIERVAQINGGLPMCLKEFKTSAICFLFSVFAFCLFMPRSSIGQSYVLCHDSNDCVDYGLPSVEQPLVGEPYMDLNSGIEVTRITDNDDSSLQYSRYSAVSSDGRYLITARDYLFDLQDNSPLGKAPHVSNDPWGTDNCGGDMEYRWDYSGAHPTRLYYRHGARCFSFLLTTRITTFTTRTMTASRERSLPYWTGPAWRVIESQIRKAAHLADR